MLDSQRLESIMRKSRRQEYPAAPVGISPGTVPLIGRSGQSLVMLRRLAAMKTVLGILTLTAIAGCGSSVQDAWESAGATPGWYGREYSGFCYLDEKPKGKSIPAFWCKEEFDLDRLATLPIPPKPFALHFGGSNLTDSHLELLKRFHLAEGLGLNRTQITNAGLTHLLAFPHIETLDLADVAVNDEGINTLSKLPQLKVLILTFADVSDSGAETLSQMKTLEVLDISRTAVTDNGLEKLAALPKLRYLGVAKTQATSDGIAAVKKEHPDLEVYE
jgi:hypothetical protein